MIIAGVAPHSCARDVRDIYDEAAPCPDGVTSAPAQEILLEQKCGLAARNESEGGGRGVWSARNPDVYRASVSPSSAGTLYKRPRVVSRLREGDEAWAMNIFVLDETPAVAARYHCDKHVVKMVLETAQLLCTVSHLFGDTVPYRPTHAHHPCCVWVQRTLGNWLWLRQLGLALADEYAARYGKRHKSGAVIRALRAPRRMGARLARTPFAQCVPEKYRVEGDAVAAYRAYYAGDKRSMCSYTGVDWPDWLSR